MAIDYLQWDAQLADHISRHLDEIVLPAAHTARLRDWIGNDSGYFMFSIGTPYVQFPSIASDPSGAVDLDFMLGPVKDHRYVVPAPNVGMVESASTQNVSLIHMDESGGGFLYWGERPDDTFLGHLSFLAGAKSAGHNAQGLVHLSNLESANGLYNVRSSDLEGLDGLDLYAAAYEAGTKGSTVYFPGIGSTTVSGNVWEAFSENIYRITGRKLPDFPPGREVSYQDVSTVG